MKQTRNLEIEEKVFEIADLKRFSEIFDKQKKLAEKSDHHYQLEYSISFEDKTSLAALTSLVVIPVLMTIGLDLVKNHL